MKRIFLFLALLAFSLPVLAQSQSGYGGDGKAASGATISASVRLYETPPTAPTLAAGAGGTTTTGNHNVKITCYNSTGETSGGTASSTVDTATAQFAITAIPLCSGLTTGRKVYMNTVAAPTSYYLVATIANNTGTTSTVTSNDATIAGGAAIPTTNTMIDPRITVVNEGVSKMYMPTTTSSSTGVIYKGSSQFIHNFKSPTGSSATPDGHNIFIGVGSGNFTMGNAATNTAHGSYNIGIGDTQLTAVTNGYANISIGYGGLAVGTTFSANVAIGNNTLYQTTGDENVAVGPSAGYDLGASSSNTLIGTNTGRGLSTGGKNTVIGANVTGLSGSLANNVILADGDGNKKIWADSLGTVSFGPGAVPTVIGAAPTHAQGFAILQGEESLTIAAAATTDTAFTVPINAVILSVNVRVTTVIPTAATFTVTGATSGTVFNTAAVAVAATTTDAGTKSCPYFNVAAQKIRITPDVQPAAATGVVRITVVYYIATPPTS